MGDRGVLISVCTLRQRTRCPFYRVLLSVYRLNNRVYRVFFARHYPGLRRIPGMEDLSTEAARRRAIAWAFAVTQGTALAPQAYEADLLERYARGELTLAQAIADLNGRGPQVR